MITLKEKHPSLHVSSLFWTQLWRSSLPGSPSSSLANPKAVASPQAGPSQQTAKHISELDLNIAWCLLTQETLSTNKEINEKTVERYFSNAKGIKRWRKQRERRERRCEGNSDVTYMDQLYERNEEWMKRHFIWRSSSSAEPETHAVCEALLMNSNAKL